MKKMALLTFGLTYAPLESMVMTRDAEVGTPMGKKFGSKSSHAKGTCDYHNEVQCRCDVIGRNGYECHNDSNGNHPLQKLFFEGQSQDAWPNGDRNEASRPMPRGHVTTTMRYSVVVT